MTKFKRTLALGAGSSVVVGALAIGTIVLSPAALANFGAVTATTAVNIRTAPTTSSSVVGVLHRGSKLTQVGAMKNGWVPVKYGSRTAWISANYIVGARATENKPVTQAGDKGRAWTTAALNVRSSPRISDNRVGLLAKGTSVTLTGLVSGGFSQISFQDGRAWVSTDYLSQAAAPSPDPVTTKGSVRATTDLLVRNSSGKAIPRYTDIPAGTVLPTTGQVSGRITEVVWRGTRVWVSSPWVAPLRKNTGTTPPPAPGAIGSQYATVSLNVRTGPGSSYSVVDVVPPGTELKVTGVVKNGFARVVVSGATRWVSAQYLSKTKPSTGGGSGGGTSGGGSIDLSGSEGLGGLQANSRHIVNVVAERYGLHTFYGVRPASLPDHPSGHAVDCMLPNWNSSSGNARGWEIARWLRANAETLDIQYIIFDQHIWNISRDAEGWRAMADRGSPTENHKDHVHVTTRGL